MQKIDAYAVVETDIAPYAVRIQCVPKPVQQPTLFE